MIIALVVAYLAYKYANENGRNGILWALAGIAVFIGTQMLVTFGGGILIGIGAGVLGWGEGAYDDPALVWPITLLAIVISVFNSWLLLRYVSKPVESEPAIIQPPPPPTFGDDEQL